MSEGRSLVATGSRTVAVRGQRTLVDRVGRSGETVSGGAADGLVHDFMIRVLSTDQYDKNSLINGHMLIIHLWEHLTPDIVDTVSRLRASFKVTASLEEKVKLFTAVACNVVSARRGLACLTAFPSTVVDISECDHDEIAALMVVYETIKRKSALSNRPITRRDDGELSAVDKFRAEFPLMEMNRMVPSTFLRNNSDGIPRLALLYSALEEHEKDHFRAILDGLPDDEKHHIETLMNHTVPKRSNIRGFANLFQIDYAFSLVYLFKRCNLELVDLFNFARSVAMFSFSPSITRADQTIFWKRIEPRVKRIRYFMHEDRLTLHDDPYKMTFSRMMSCVAILFPTASELGIMNIRDPIRKLRVIAQICRLQVRNKSVNDELDSTSMSEHMVHQILCQGGLNLLMFNKNFLPGSATSHVTFRYEDGFRVKFDMPTDNRKGLMDLVSQAKQIAPAMNRRADGFNDKMILTYVVCECNELLLNRALMDLNRDREVVLGLRNVPNVVPDSTLGDWTTKMQGASTITEADAKDFYTTAKEIIIRSDDIDDVVRDALNGGMIEQDRYSLRAISLPSFPIITKPATPEPPGVKTPEASATGSA